MSGVRDFEEKLNQGDKDFLRACNIDPDWRQESLLLTVDDREMFRQLIRTLEQRGVRIALTQKEGVVINGPVDSMVLDWVEQNKPKLVAYLKKRECLSLDDVVKSTVPRILAAFCVRQKLGRFIRQGRGFFLLT